MNECPTRVRTGVPPSSVTISGTAREVIRLWITVEPGWRASSREAISAVSVRGADELAPLVDEEAAVGVAVEGQPDVGAGLAHLRLQVDQVGRLDRVGLVVAGRCRRARSTGVRRRRSSLPEDGRRGVPGHPVAGVDDDPEPAAGDRREGEQVLRVVLEDVALTDRPGPLRGGRLARRDQVAYGGQAGVHAERHRAGAAHLDAVVLRRVVARGEHRAGHAEAAGGEVELVGGGQPDHRDVRTGGRRALREGAGHARARRAACRGRRRPRRRRRRSPPRRRRRRRGRGRRRPARARVPRTSYALKTADVGEVAAGRD